jgi:hypothetical protein
MKDNPNRLKKWLLSYALISILVFAFVYYIGKNYLGSSEAEFLILFLLQSTITCYFYLKVTQNSIWWSLTTMLLAYFFSFLFSLFISTITDSSSSSLLNYTLFHLFEIIINALFMFAGVYIEKKTTVKDWEDDVLDDLNV